MSNPRLRSLAASLAILAVPALSPPPGALASGPGSKPTSRPASRPASRPSEAPARTIDESDPAQVLAREVEAAHGGPEALKSGGWLAFDFVVEAGGTERRRRSHGWNPRTGEIRTAWGSGGERVEVFFEPGSLEKGAAFANGQRLEGGKAAGALEAARAAFINDSYWLAAPFKLFDEGVSLSREGEVEWPPTQWQGTRCEVLRLEFDAVGLTPGDTYWLYINPRSKLLEGWRYQPEGGQPSDFTWTHYEKVGEARLSTLKESTGGGFAIRFDNLRAGGKAPFERPAPAPAPQAEADSPDA